MIGIFFFLAFAAAQGGAVFVTAWACARRMKATSLWAKLGLMLVSLVFWIMLTFAGYVALGGEGGLMDGFGMLLMLFFSALVSTFVYFVVWAALPSSTGLHDA